MCEVALRAHLDYNALVGHQFPPKTKVIRGNSWYGRQDGTLFHLELYVGQVFFLSLRV
jgi:hypothetical protein